MRALIFSVYFLLIVGAVTTVYPFLMMLGTSVASLTDYEQYRVFPRYVYDDKALASKYLQEKYRAPQFEVFKLRYRVEEPVETMQGTLKVTKLYGRFLEMEPVLKTFDLNSPQIKARLEDWLAFKEQRPLEFCDTYFHSNVFPIGETEVAFQNYLKVKYPTLAILKRSLDEMPEAYVNVNTPYEAYDRHAWYASKDPKSVDWAAFREIMPIRMLNPITMRDVYEKFLIDRYSKIGALNESWGTSYAYFWQIEFPTTRPSDKSGPVWEEFVRKKMPMRYGQLDVAKCRESYPAFLREKYGTVEKYNGIVGDNASSLETAVLSPDMPESSLPLANWQEYYEQHAPIDGIVLDTADVRYARFLEDKYKDVDSLNSAYGTKLASFASAEPPYDVEDYADLTARKSEIRKDYFTRNYTLVLKRVFLQGRPLFNTFLLVSLTVLTQITVNPLAAYALSRYRLRYTPQVLIFMLATMAFPAEVAMIPNFLLIKELGLLNTFPALILPGLASGYSVFLLKGFFDSLPAELYEAGSIDGANELRMFWMITMPLSLPILSVIALFSFAGAYGSFLWAVTTCQNPKMWTLMVFLQQFQIEATSCPYIVMAALVVAAIPTIVVFLAAQKVLMKGIVVPTMK
jgi:multiple sugar transport system permease protein